MTDQPRAPILLDLRTVTGGELPLQLRFRAADLRTETSDADYRIVGDATFEGRVRKDEPRYHLTGRVKAVLEVDCGRCLEAFALPVEADVDLTYLPDPTAKAPVAKSAAAGKPGAAARAAAADAEEIELGDEDLTTAYYRDQAIDLGEMLREQFYLALPMRQLCRDDCQGLCPQCGINLNQGTCACDVRWEDPRLAGLQALIKKPEGQR